MQRKTSQRMVRVSLLAATCAALLFTASMRVSGTGGLTLLSTAVVDGTNDVVGTGAAFGTNGIYFSASSSLTSGEFDALAGRFASPLANGAAPTWSQSWPPAGGFDAFTGVDVGSDGVYYAGSSYSQTTDVIGGKERKEIVAKFSLTGTPGADTGGAIWVGRQRFYPGSNGYDGDEYFNAARVSVEGGTTYLYGGGHAQENGCNNNYAIRKYTAAGAIVWQWQQLTGVCGGSDINAIAVDGTNVYAAGFSGYAGNAPQILRFSAAAGSSGPAATFTGTIDAGYASGAYTSVALLGGNIYAAGYLTSGERQAYLLDEWNASGTRLVHQVWSSDATKSNGQQLTGIAAVGSRLFAVGWTRNFDNPATVHNMGGATVPVFPGTSTYHGFADGMIFELDPATGGVLSTTSYGANDAKDEAFTSVTTDGIDLYVVGGERTATFYHVITQRYALSIATTLASVSGSASYGGPASLQATLSSSGAPISGATVTFTLSGSAVGSAVTGANGVAQLTNISTAGKNAGSYPVGAAFAASGDFLASSATGNLTIDQAGATITVTVPGASLVSGQPHAPYNGQAHPAVGAVTGVLGAADSLGAATITYTDLAANTTSSAAPVNGGSYRVNASFAGNTNYLAGSNNSVVLTIDPSSTSTALQTWGSLATTGTGPAFGSYGSAEFNDGAGRVIVVSADSSNPFVLNAANGLGSSPSWTSYAAPGHPVQKNAAAAYDPASNTLMMYGGCSSGCTPITNQVWVLSHANGVGGTPAWTNRTPASSPAARQAMARGYDPTSNRLIIFGGQDGGGSGGSTHPDVWALTNANGSGGSSAWTQLLPDNAPPPGQWGPSSWYDSASNRLIVAGGGAQFSGTPTRAVWALTNANGVSATPPHWINLIPEGAAGSPNGFVLWPAAYDAATNRAMLFETGTSNLWVVTNANGLGGTPAYNHVTLTGGPAGLTDNIDLPYDAANHRLTVIPSASQILLLGSSDGVGRINPSNAGQSVTFTATVSPISPATGARTGTVTFKDGGNTLGTASVNGDGQAIFTTSALSAAGSPHAITAVYDGDVNFATSTSSALSQTINPVATPTAAFTPAPNPAACGQVVTFDGTGSHANGGLSLASYAWSFGDGATAAGSTTTHAYGAFGTYNAMLTVTDTNVPAQTAVSTVMVNVNQGNRAPVANHGGPYVVDLGATAAFNGTGSSDADAGCGDSIAYAWKINGGTYTLTGASPTLTAAQVGALGAGTFAVSLTVTDSFGATNVAATTISIYNNVPTASFTATPNPAACTQTITFNGSLSAAGRPDRAIVGYAWSFGDGTTGAGSTVAHAYGAFGAYTATLTVTDNNVPPKTAVASTVVNVNLGNVAPVANPGGPYAVDLGSTAVLSGAGSTDPNAACGDSIASYSWSINSGAIALTGASPTLTVAQVNALGAGTFPVSLTVTDTFGATNTSATTIALYNNVPTAAFPITPNPAACQAPISFDGRASFAGRPDRAIASYAWTFGDGASATGASVVHTYNTFGNYTATLTVTDTNVPAKTASLSHVVSVNQGNVAPVAAAGGPYTAVLGGTIGFNGMGSSDPNAACGDTIVSYSWKIDGGALILTGPSPSLTAAQLAALGAGSHTVSLTVTDTFSATGSASTTLVIQHAEDGDGIPGNPDAAGNAGIDTQPDVFSNNFDDRLAPGTGTTFGTIINRSGWNVAMSNLADPAGVQATISGGGAGSAVLTACAGNQKQVLLDAAGEKADVTCIGATTISVTARTASPIIDVKEAQPQSFTCTFAGGIFLPLGLRNSVCNRTNYIVAHLATGNTVSMGSPVTADPANPTPVLVDVLDDYGVVVGSLTLDPGASVDVTFGHDEFTDATTAQLTLLAGTAIATVSGVTLPLTGQPQTFLIDTMPPAIGPVSNITATATSTAGAVVNYPMPTVTDVLDPNPQITGNPPSGSVFPHGQTTVTLTARDTAGNVATRTFTVNVQAGLLSIDVTPHDVSRHPGQGGQSFTATGTFSQGAPQILSSGGGGSGGGLFGPTSPMWEIDFIPSGNFSACATAQYPAAMVSDNWTSQNLFDVNGSVHETWSVTTPVVHVDGTINSSDVVLSLACTSGAATGTVNAHWTGTRYEGSLNFNGQSSGVSITGWSQKAPMPTGRFGVSALSLGGKVYSIGGVGGSCNTPAPCSFGPLTTVESYDPATGAWTTAPSLSIGRESAGAATLGGKAYVIGGHMPGGDPTGAVEVLDPAIPNSWTTLPQADWMPTARAGFALVSDGTYLYALGGNTLSGNGGAIDTVERFNPSAPSGSRWSTLAAHMPVAGSTAAAGVLNGKIVIAGSDGTSRTDVYDIASGQWRAGAPMPAQRGSMAAAVANGGLWVIGGTSNGSLNYGSWVYYLATQTRSEGWAGVGSIPTARAGLGAAAVGDVVYAVGGTGAAQASGEYLGLTTNEALSIPAFDDLSTGGGSGGGSGTYTVQWQSTNTAVADVDANGFATPHVPGQTTIVASVGSISGQTTFTVVNSSPTVQITGNINGGPSTNGPFTMSEGNQALQLQANAQDPDNDQLTYAWSIVSGGGVLGGQFGTTSSQSLSYTNADGPVSVTVQVIATDSLGASATATATIAVNNLPPQVSMPNFGTFTTQLGSSQNFACASFTDQGVNDAPWSAMVDYGDGSGVQPAVLNVPSSCGGPGGPGGPMGALNLAHAYNHTGTFTVTVSIRDKDGGAGTGTMSVTVNSAMPSMNLTSSKPSGAVYGDSLTFTATVTGASGAPAPTGSVTFTIDGNQAAAQTVSLNATGQASISTSTLTATVGVSSHSISAVYGGDLNYQTSSRTQSQFVGKANPGGTFVSSVNPSTYGQNVTFTVTVTTPAGVGAPTGTVTFTVDGNQAAAQTVSLNASGQASFSINSLNAFGHNISANYGGDSNFQNKFFQSISQNVNRVSPIVKVTATPNPSTYGQAVTLQAEVTSLLGNPIGTITFYDGTTQSSPALSSQQSVTIDPSNATRGTVTFTTNSLSVGAHTITAFYNSSNGNLNGSNGSTPVTVNLPPPPAFSQISPSPAGACICTPSVDVGTASQFWFAMADGSGQLRVTLVAHPNGQAGTVNAKIYDAAGVQAAQMTASYPTGFDLPDVRSPGTVATTPNAIYRVEVSSPTSTFGYARYWLKFEGAVEAGVKSQTFPAFERGWAEWVLNADGGDSLNVRIFSQGTPQPPASQSTPETVTYQWIAPDGTRSPAQPQALTATMPPGIDQLIPPPAAVAPGIWTLVVNSTGPYRLQKMTGADRGIYLNSRTAGFGTVHVTIVDGHGNAFTGPVTFTVSSNDVSEKNDSFTTDKGGFEATDVPVGPTFHLQVEGPIGLTASPAQFDVTLSMCDQQLNVTIVVADTTPPSITGPADITVEATGPDGATVDPGEAIGSDVVSAVTITRTPAGNQFALGTTNVVWMATDAEGNSSTATQHITVVDTTAPTVSVPANITAEAASASGAAVTFSASATDIVNGSTAVSCAPASGSTFVIGATTISCSATDGHNTGSGSFTVTVVDTTAPSITAPADVTAEATGPNGAFVNPGHATGSDVAGAVTISGPSPAQYPLGTTTVTWTATDQSGNHSTATQRITVVDTTKPTLALPADITVDATSPAGAVVNYTVSATDIANGTLAVSCTRASGTTFPIGTTTVTCSASDASGNGVSGSFHVSVQAAAAQVSALVSRVDFYNLAQGIGNSLDTKLQNVLAALNAAKGRNASNVCGQMGAFINETMAQSGKKLTVAQADQLITAGQQIRAVLGCQ